MKGFIRLGLAVWLLAGAAGALQAQTHRFEIRFGSHVIGNIEAHCSMGGAARNLLIKSRVQMKLLSKFNSDIKCEYNNNVLVSARSVRSSGKGGDEKATATRREGHNYIIDHNGEQSTLSNTEIQHSVADLYFTEPRQVTRIYSETLGKFLPLKALGNGAYELSLPEGKKNIYKYQKGVLMEVEVNHTLGKAYFVKLGITN